MEASSHARRAPFEAAEAPADGHAVLDVGVVDAVNGVCAWVFDAAVETIGAGAGLRVNGADPVEAWCTAGDDFVYCRYDPPPAAGDPWVLDPAAPGGSGVAFPDGRPLLAGSGACVAS